jgi:hypothetical protein
MATVTSIGLSAYFFRRYSRRITLCASELNRVRSIASRKNSTGSAESDVNVSTNSASSRASPGSSGRSSKSRTTLRVADHATDMPDIDISKVVHTTCNAPRSFMTTSSCHLPRRFDMPWT